MLFGFLVVTSGNRVDQIGQGIASVAAMGSLILLILRERRRNWARNENKSAFPFEPAHTT